VGSVAVIYTCGDAVTKKDHKWYLYFIETVNVCKTRQFRFSIQLDRAYFQCLGYGCDCWGWMGHTSNFLDMLEVDMTKDNLLASPAMEKNIGSFL